MLDSVQRLNIIFDVYQNGFCEREINEGRVKKNGVRLRQRKHRYLNKFFENIENG